MVARLVRDPFDREGWFFELKWDAFRTTAEADGTDGVKLYSRNQSDFKNPRLLYVEHVEREGLAMFAGALALGVEGIVAKDAKSPYVEGPRVTWHWQKIKNRDYERQEKIEFHPRKA